MLRAQQRSVPLGIVAALLALAATVPALAQPAGNQTLEIPYRFESGVVENTGQEPMVIFSTQVTVPEASWVRLTFDQVELSGEIGSGQESYLLVTSMLDGAQQYLNGLHVLQWRNTSAYFNGDTVLVELYAYPGTGPNRVSTKRVLTGLAGAGGRSICGPTDDRELSYDPRAARLVPAGCTGWLIDDCTHCLFTAGHCAAGNNVAEFNVPLSNPDGTLNHPPPEDQYSFDPASMQTNGGQGEGDDWAYFGVFPNSNTGLTAAEAQGDWYHLALPPPVGGQNIRITGYGTVSAPVDKRWNQVQKTHVGPYALLEGTKVEYRTDTTGGNSGSPVILEETGEAIGIHTHGGCSGGGGANVGTGLNHAQVQAALANPRGVCVCPPGLDVSPDGDFVSAGDPGGPFTPGFQVYTLVNMSDASIDWQVTHVQSWVSLDQSSGVLAPAGSVDVTVSINNEAKQLPVGQYEDVLTFTNLTTHDGDTTRKVKLTVGGPKQIYLWNMDSNPGWTTSGLWAWGKPTGGGGQYGQPDPTAGYTGQNVYGYNLGGDYESNLPERHLTSGAIDCTSLAGVTLKFRRWLGVEDAAYDHASVRISTDGTNFTNVWENSAAVTDGSWQAVELNLATWADHQPTVYLRWTMGTTDESWNYCGWNIDDVEIWALAPSAGLVGDLNCDGSVDFGDINPFVLALSDPEGYENAFPGCPFANRDINGDGTLDFGDVNPFIDLLSGQ